MADRRRFAVALVVPPPTSIEIDGLRRALGDGQLGRIEPHVTIVPPINLRDDQVADALAVVDAAAAATPPIMVTLGPVSGFGADSPVRFLAVDPWAPVEALYRACWVGVLDRPEQRSFHPHVTVDINGGPRGEPDPAVEVLASYRVDVVFDAVDVLEYDPAARQWDTYLRYRLTGP